MTGGKPESFRKLIGRWLREADGDAVDVLIAIEEAHQKQIIDPRAWIGARFASRLRLRRDGLAVRSEGAIRRIGVVNALDRLNAAITARGGDAPRVIEGIATAIEGPDESARRAPSWPFVGKFYAQAGSPELEAWSAYERRIGKSGPRDKSGGWGFPSRWPPDLELVHIDKLVSR
jgi:hypothetical protein